jgi:hypothetical protein
MYIRKVRIQACHAWNTTQLQHKHTCSICESRHDLYHKLNRSGLPMNSLLIGRLLGVLLYMPDHKSMYSNDLLYTG